MKSEHMKRVVGLDPHDQPVGHLVGILPAFCPQIAPIGPFLPTVPTHNVCAVYNLGEHSYHGVEEVIVDAFGL